MDKGGGWEEVRQGMIAARQCRAAADNDAVVVCRQREIIGDFVYYLVPHGILVSRYRYLATVLLYLRTYSLLVLKPQQECFLDSLGI